MFRTKSNSTPAVLALLVLLAVFVAGFRRSPAGEKEDVARGAAGPRASDPLHYLFVQSDLIVAGEIVGEPSGESTEAGVIHYDCALKVPEVLKGKRPSKPEISVCVTRFESSKEERLPWIRKGGKCLLFLQESAGKTPATFDWYFGSQPYNRMMAADLKSMAEKQGNK
jgi:hypothetical protein